MDPRIRSLITGMIANRRRRRSDFISQRVAKLLENIAAFSSASGVISGRAAANELLARADIWLTLARRVVFETRTPWSEEIASEMGAVLTEELVTDARALNELHKRRVRGAGDVPDSPQIGEAYESAISHVRLELQLLILREEKARVPLGEQLAANRYAAVRAALEKARDFFSEQHDDYKPVVIDAVAAVEQLARLFVGRPTATLGDAIKDIRGSGRIPAPLLKGIEEIWGWASGEPGVRHGAAVDAPIGAGEARYVLTLAEGALLLLLDRDDQ